jgi:hypothetical protein
MVTVIKNAEKLILVIMNVRIKHAASHALLVIKNAQYNVFIHIAHRSVEIHVKIVLKIANINANIVHVPKNVLKYVIENHVWNHALKL